ncbi:unnamed protein product [Sphagnum troendelagicum]
MLPCAVIPGSHVVALLEEAADVLAATLSMCTARRRDPHHKTSSARKRGAGTQQTNYELNDRLNITAPAGLQAHLEMGLMAGVLEVDITEEDQQLHMMMMMML